MAFMRELITNTRDSGGTPICTNQAIINYIDLHPDITQIFKTLENGDIPENYHKDIYTPNRVGSIKHDSVLIPMVIRNIFTRRYGFPLISMNWARELKHNVIKDGKCLEVMCGSGMWTKALRACGTDIIATDNNEWCTKIHGYSNWKSKPFINDIEVIDALAAIEKYGKDVDFILMSWPPYDEPIANMILMKMREVNPKCSLLMIGEDQGGCTADDKFFDNVKITEELAEPIVQIAKINGDISMDKKGKIIDHGESLFKSFWGINDKLFIFK